MMEDNIHIIWQFAELYGIESTEILEEVERKNARTLKRMGEDFNDWLIDREESIEWNGGED